MLVAVPRWSMVATASPKFHTAILPHSAEGAAGAAQVRDVHQLLTHQGGIASTSGDQRVLMIFGHLWTMIDNSYPWLSTVIHLSGFRWFPTNHYYQPKFIMVFRVRLLSTISGCFTLATELGDSFGNPPRERSNDQPRLHDLFNLWMFQPMRVPGFHQSRRIFAAKNWSTLAHNPS